MIQLLDLLVDGFARIFGLLLQLLNEVKHLLLCELQLRVHQNVGARLLNGLELDSEVTGVAINDEVHAEVLGKDVRIDDGLVAQFNIKDFCLILYLRILALNLLVILLGLLHLFSLGDCLPSHIIDLTCDVLTVVDVGVGQAELDLGTARKSDLEGVEKRLVQVVAPSFLIRVNKDEVALTVAILRDLVHEDGIVAARETDCEELALKAWDPLDVL